LCSAFDTNGLKSWEKEDTLHSGAVTITLDENRVIREGPARKSIKVRSGEKFQVLLENDQVRTGWETAAPPAKIVELVSQEQTPKPDGGDRAIGTYLFNYKALAPGTITLQFDLIAPGGPDVKERRRSARIRTFVLDVEVEK